MRAASLLNRVMRLAQSPQAKRAVNHAVRYAQSPEGKRKIEQARKQLAARGKRRHKRR
jgi:hypothetical protein